jgi:DNA-binding LacI/PurR family transcriptional regulator
MPKTPTITDIARRLNLANTTVAEVLRGKPGYNESTRQRILSTAKRVGYRPNYLSKALAGSKSKTIGVVAGLIETPILGTMVRPIELAARRSGYLCYLVDYSGEDEQQLVSHVQNLLDRRVDGLVVHQGGHLPAALDSLLRGCSIPVVRTGMLPADATGPIVRMDRDQAARQLAEHLALLGHREAAFISSPYMYIHPNMKLKPLGQAFARAGIKLDVSERWVIEQGQEYSYGCLKLLRREIDRGALPTALLFNSDTYALEALAALHDARLRVPQDVSVVGFNDDYFAALTRPALTTIRQPQTEIGEKAFRLLMELVNNPGAVVESQAAYCELVVRDSTGPCRSRV